MDTIQVLHEIRASKEISCPWDEEEKTLWVRNLFVGWEDIKSYIDKKNLWDKLFAWGIGKYWRENGNVFWNENYGLRIRLPD